MEQTFFRVPWAFSGDRTSPPVAQQPDGSVSYAQGFGPLYEADPEVNPNAKPVPRDETNGLYYDLTLALGAIQAEGAPEFIAAADNGGTAYPYARGARVRYRTAPGQPLRTYLSRIDNNTSPPTNATNWAAEVFEVSTNPEALAGTRNDVMITPSSLAAALAASGVSVPAATEAVAGIQRNASNAEAQAQTSTARTITPAALAAWGSARAVLLTGAQSVAGIKTHSDPIQAPAFAGSSGVLLRPNGPGSTSGQVAISTTGAVSAPGGFDRPSSRTVKIDLGEFPYGLAEVLALAPAHFAYRHGVGVGDRARLGFYAEDVQERIDEAVTETTDPDSVSPLLLQSEQLIPVLWRAVQQLAARVEELEGR